MVSGTSARPEATPHDGRACLILYCKIAIDVFMFVDPPPSFYRIHPGTDLSWDVCGDVCGDVWGDVCGIDVWW